MGKVITVSSGKGGVGKTVSSINLAIALNNLGKNVILVDANLTTPNVGLNLGAPIVPISLNHVLNGKNKTREAIYEHHSGTKILPASLSLEALKNIKTTNFKKIIRELKKNTDYVIVDSAAGLGKEALMAYEIADEILMVTNPEMPAVTDALKAIRVAGKMKKDILGVVVNKRKKGRKEMTIKNICNILEKPITGSIPECDSVRESIMMRDAVVNTHPKSGPAKSYKKIAARMAGVKLVEPRGFFDRLFRRC